MRSAWRRRHPSQGLKLQRSLCLPSRHLLFFVFFTAAATQTPPNTSDRQSTVSPVLVSLEHFHLINHPFQYHSVPHQLHFCRAKEMEKKKENCHPVCGVRFGVVVGALHHLQGGGGWGDEGGGTAASLASRLTLAPRHVSGPFAVERFLKSHCLFLRERAGGESHRMEETAGCGSPDKVSSHIVPPATELALFFYFFSLSVLQCISLHRQSPDCRGRSVMLKLHLSDKRQTANTEGIQVSVHLCNGQTIIPTGSPPPRWLIPSARQSPGWVGGQSLPDEHGWQYLPSISLVSHGRKQPEVQLVRERDPFSAGINPLTGNKAERAITPPGSDRPMKAKRCFFFLPRTTCFTVVTVSEAFASTASCTHTQAQKQGLPHDARLRGEKKEKT